MYRIDSLRFVMDETSAPYEEGENPYIQTELDNEFEQMIINKYNLTTKEMESYIDNTETDYHGNKKICNRTE